MSSNDTLMSMFKNDQIVHCKVKNLYGVKRVSIRGHTIKIPYAIGLFSTFCFKMFGLNYSLVSTEHARKSYNKL